MSRSARFWILFIILLAGAWALYLVGDQRVALWDRDEPWYAECSREMLRSGDWVVPRFLGEWRVEKPPLIYWLQASTMWLIGDTPLAARLPSSLGVVVTAAILGLMVRKYAGAQRALWSVLIFSTCGVAIAAAKFCITDGMYMCLISIGQACLATMYAAHQRREHAPPWAAPLFWVVMGLAGLTKGPQGLVMQIFSLVILLFLDVKGDRRSHRSWAEAASWWWELKPLIAIPILVVVVAPWLIMIHYRANGFVAGLFQKVKEHAQTSMEGHGKPPGYHALLIFGTFFPWSILLVTAVRLAWQNRHLPVIRFGIAATAGPWLLMETFVFTKLPFYVLPAFPGLAFLTADGLVRCIRSKDRRALRPEACIWTIAVLGMSVGPFLAIHYSRDLPAPTAGIIAFCICGVLYAILVFTSLWRNRVRRAAVLMGVGMAVMILILYGAIFPGLQVVRLSERLVDHLRAVGACGGDIRVADVGYEEPSLAFYQGGGVRNYDHFAQLGPPAAWPRWIVIREKEWKEVPHDIQAQFQFIAQEWGIDYSQGGQTPTVLVLKNLSPVK
jgi:4-amino-4-deoxy-L-arabinose transferase-like glycosyltransferase